MFIRSIVRIDPPFLLAEVKPNVFFVPIAGRVAPVSFNQDLVMFEESIFGACLAHQFQAITAGLVAFVLPGDGQEIVAGEKLGDFVPRPV